MKIALASWNRKKFGGAETYLDTVIPGLARAGHELAHLCEVALPADRAPIGLPPGAPVWSGEDLGIDESLARLAAWRPTVIFDHGLRSPALEDALRRLAPTVFYAHDYYGACISGAKSFAFPHTRPCGCDFSWRCLARFYPRRCGGLNPVTMARLYRREMWRLDLLRGYDAIVVGSEHMRGELIRQGLEPKWVRLIVPPIVEQRARPPADPGASKEWRLLFAGRMVHLKGGELLLQALPLAAAILQRPLRLVMAGDGPARVRWERIARRMTIGRRDLAVEFPGWLEAAASAEVAARSDLLVMPSLWPEPFGLAGLEAGFAGVPTVAFAVGGIPEWLIDGQNGHLAAGDPPTVSGLAEAIVRSLADPAHHAELGRGARAATGRFSLVPHVDQLIEFFEEAHARRDDPAQRMRERSRVRAAVGGKAE
jgi:glycosyltransferase involved in cell wall biosynthesis